MSSRLALPIFFVVVLAGFCLAAPNFASAGNFENLMAGYLHRDFGHPAILPDSAARDRPVRRRNPGAGRHVHF